MPDEAGNRLTRLETKFDERWDAHDAHAKELKNDMKDGFSEVKDTLKDIGKTLGVLPCGQHHQRIKANNKIIWGVVVAGALMFIGVVVRIISTHFFNQMTMRIP